MTARQLNRATLARQLLLQRESLPVAEAIRRITAVQAQDPASPYVALWNRIADFAPADLDAAFADREIVKATLMRITLHAVHAGDYQRFHHAMQPTLRGARLSDRRFTATGLSADDADELLGDLLAFAAQPRTGAELEAWVDDHVGTLPKPGVWWALRSYAPLRHAPVGGPWSFGQRPSYEAARSDPHAGHPGSPDDALVGLVESYLSAFGPASVADVAQFALVQRARARKALGTMSGRIEQLEAPDGTVLFDLPGTPRPDPDTPAPPRLMAMWDSILLAYADRSRVVPPEYRKLVARNNGDTLPTLLVDGCVAGVWRAFDDGIEATAFHRLAPRVWDGLAAEAEGLLRLVADRSPEVYRRYHRWWDKLPAAEVRRLPG